MDTIAGLPELDIRQDLMLRRGVAPPADLVRVPLARLPIAAIGRAGVYRASPAAARLER
jgi:hypothetical protein